MIHDTPEADALATHEARKGEQQRRTRMVHVTLAIEDAMLDEAEFIFKALEGNHVILHTSGDEAWELSVMGNPVKASRDRWAS